MVRDGIYYALAFTAAGLLVNYMAGPWTGLPLFLVGAFCAYFFRDPDRLIPVGPVAVSPADGKVVAVVAEPGGLTRISIFLNVFDVHVNRSPVSGVVTDVTYTKGKFLVASREIASAENEQNRVTVRMEDGSTVAFTQISGLIARRIVCWKKPGDFVQTGERFGLIKFGSRMDVFLGSEWRIEVSVGQRVEAGTSVLGRRGGVVEFQQTLRAPIEEAALCRT